MSFVDMSFVEKKVYEGKKSAKSNKYLYSDLLAETSRAVGFDLTLLHEDQCKNKRFVFLEEDVEMLKTLKEFMESKKGKRLRCKDYKGAGGDFVYDIIEILYTLGLHAGVSEQEMWDLRLNMLIYTDGIVLKDTIIELSDEFQYDIENYFFIEEGDLDGLHCLDDDHFTGVGKIVFLEYILTHIEMDLSDVRGVYWFYRDYMEDRHHAAFMKEVDYVKSLTDDEREQFKNYLMEQLEYEKLVNNNEEHSNLIYEFLKVENGKGRLQDLKKQKAKLINIFEIEKDVAENIIKTKVPQSEKYYKKTEARGLVKEYIEAICEVREAEAMFYLWKCYRKKHLVSFEEQTIREIEFKERFGTELFYGGD